MNCTLEKKIFDWIVFVNGKLHKELSKVSIENVEFLSFNYALNDEKHKEVFEKYFNSIASKEQAFTNLNLAYCKYGFFLKVPKNVVIESQSTFFIFLRIRKKTRSTIQEIFDR